MILIDEFRTRNAPHRRRTRDLDRTGRHPVGASVGQRETAATSEHEGGLMIRFTMRDLKRSAA